MKKLKLALFALSISFFVLPAIAQEKVAEIGVMAGYSYTVPKLKDESGLGSGISTSRLNGFHAGPVLKLNIDEQFSLQTGALFNHFAGTHLSPQQALLKKNLGTWNQSSTSLTALDFPIRLNYAVELADDFYFLIFAGPNLNYALSKQTDRDYYVDRKINKHQAVIGENIYESIYFNKLDLQMGAGMGIQWMDLFFKAGFDWGFLNRTSYTDTRFRSNDIKVSFGYHF